VTAFNFHTYTFAAASYSISIEHGCVTPLYCGFSWQHIIMTELKNDLLLKALRKEKVSRPPVWMMRQAGRYLPDYIKLREKYDFFTRVQTPELATDITLQPVHQVGVDAAIIFSDILVIPQAMGVEVLMEEGKGPSLPKTIKTQKDVDALKAALR